jgi:hypothetical protein
VTVLTDALAVFESATYWRATKALGKGFAVAYPADAAKVDAYVKALAAGSNPAVPTGLASKHAQGLVGMLAALAPVAPPPPPPPPPPPSGKHVGIYLDPGDWNPPFAYDGSQTYLDEYNKARTAGLPISFAMMDLNANDVKGVGNARQLVLIPNGLSAADLNKYYVPCAALKTTAGLPMVGGAVIWDEPGVDNSTVAAVKGQYAAVKHLTPGVDCIITQFDPGDLATQITLIKAGGFADKVLWDNYPARTGWDLNQFKSGINKLRAAGVRYGAVIDAFQAKNYPMPTEAQLTSQIQYLLSLDDCEDLSIYAWGDTESGAPHLQDQNGKNGTPNLMGVLTSLLS